MANTLKLSIDLSRGVSKTSENDTPLDEDSKEKKTTGQGDISADGNRSASLSNGTHSDLLSKLTTKTSRAKKSADIQKGNGSSGSEGKKKRKKKAADDGGSAAKSSQDSNDGRLVNLKVPTAKAQKRRKIKTNFDAIAQQDDDYLQAQKLEAERLERLKKSRQSDDHLQQFTALLAPHVQGQPVSPLPLLNVNANDFDDLPHTSYDPNRVKKQENEDMEVEREQKPQTMGMAAGGREIKTEGQQGQIPEIIDLSSDDEDEIQEIGRVSSSHSHFQDRSRTRWVGSEKEREDRMQIEEQYTKEKERLRRQNRRIEDLEDIKCTEGRLLVNSGHGKEEPDIYVADHLTHVLQPHQLGGIRFMFDNIITSLEDYKTSQGFGCILAHSMGLGKTLQMITFVEIFMRVTRARKALIIVPINTIQNWMAEFDKWLPKISSGGETLRAFEVFLMGDAIKNFDQRVDMIQTWGEKGGVLIIGYDMFRLMIRATQPKKQKPSRPKIRFLNGQNLNRDGQPATAASEPNLSQLANEQSKEGDAEEELKLEEAKLEDPDDGYTASGRVRKEANEIIRKNLLDPGPELVVADEGHKIKNLNSDISMALSNIKTKRRVVLTGYPLQNNLMEYYVMVDFVRPKYLGEKKSFSLMFEKPIKNGQCIDSTPADVKLARQRTHVLIEKLKGFVQRRTHNLLKKILPPNREFVILLRKSPIQRELYRQFLIYAGDELAQGNATFNPLKAFAACSKIWNHPDILAITLQRRREKEEAERSRRGEASNSQCIVDEQLSSESGGCESADDLWNGSSLPKEFRGRSNGNGTNGFVGLEDDSLSKFSAVGTKKARKVKGTRKAKATTSVTAVGCGNGTANEDMEPFEDEEFDKGLKYDWAEPVMNRYRCGVLENGYKLALTLEIIDQSTIRDEKILVFSQNLTALNLIEEFLDKRRVQTAQGESDSWFKGRNYFRFDGSTSGTERERLINRFNSEPAIRLFLISTRAGSLGINLVSASRCVIFDACWNPCHDSQAVCRIYRYGQQKKTFIYRLILDNSMERAIFNRQISKHGLQQRVVDEAQVDANITQKELEALLIYDEELDVNNSKHEMDNWDLEDDLLQDAANKCNAMLSEMPFLHESLMLEREDGLSEEEKKEAELWFEKEQLRTATANRETAAQANEMFDSLLAGDDHGTAGSTLDNLAINNYRHSNTLNGVPSWALNSGSSPVKSTPMPNVVQRRNYSINGGGATMQSVKASLSPFAAAVFSRSNSNSNNSMSAIASQLWSSPMTLKSPFPGASWASAARQIDHGGSMQKIKTDRPLLLTNINRPNRVTTVPVSSEVILVRMSTAIYINYNGPSGIEILDCRGSVFDNSPNMRLITTGTRPGHPGPLVARMPPSSHHIRSNSASARPSSSGTSSLSRSSEPDIIELD